MAAGTREDVIQKRATALEKLLRALSRAADLVKTRPGAAREIMAQWLKVPLTDLAGDRLPVRYGLCLNQDLLVAMEDEARWMINNKLTGQTRLPDFLDYFSPAPLAQIAPRAMRLVIPTSERTTAPSSGSGQERP